MKELFERFESATGLVACEFEIPGFSSRNVFKIDHVEKFLDGMEIFYGDNSFFISNIIIKLELVEDESSYIIRGIHNEIITITFMDDEV